MLTLLKGVIKDTDAQPDEDTPGRGLGGALSTGASVLWDWGAPPSR